jgi:hypothetical protein
MRALIQFGWCLVGGVLLVAVLGVAVAVGLIRIA